MIDRFTGPEGPRHIRQAIHEQQCVEHNAEVTTALFDGHQLAVFKKDETLIVEGSHENDLYLILAGLVSIRVKGREMAIRQQGQHVGEMALLEPAKAQSATVVALDEVVTVKVPEPKFATLADKYPFLWRRIAMELADRLRERSKYVRAPNPRPVVFIGSSSEGRHVAEEIQAGLAHLNAVVYVWTDNIFIPGHYTIQDLENQITNSDLGILVFTQDDHVVNASRKVDMDTPRDNVILELGMCIAALGHERALVVHPKTRNLKIPTDLLGITTLPYDGTDPTHLSAAIGPVCTAISKLIHDLGPR